MKAHDLARALLAGPNVEVAVAMDEANDYATSMDKVEVEKRYTFDEGKFEWGEEPCDIVVIYYSSGSETFSTDRP